jgi:hypothetical protein
MSKEIGTTESKTGQLVMESMPVAYIAIYKKLQQLPAHDFPTVMERMQLAAVIYEASELLRKITPVHDRDLARQLPYVPSSLRKRAMLRAINLGIVVTEDFKGSPAWRRPDETGDALTSS